MSYFLFTKAIFEGRAIDVYNYGQMERDFTFVDDIVEGIVRVMKKIPISNADFDRHNPDISSSWAPHRIFNIGNSNSIKLGSFISTLEEIIGKKAKKNLLPMPKGDVQSTFADTKSLESYVNFKPKTSIKHGLEEFVKWYKMFYKI